MKGSGLGLDTSEEIHQILDKIKPFLGKPDRILECICTLVVADLLVVVGSQNTSKEGSDAF